MNIKAFYILLLALGLSTTTHNLQCLPRPKTFVHHHVRPRTSISNAFPHLAAPSDSWWDNTSWPVKGVILAAGAIGIYYTGKYIYNYFFALTDAQEIEQALSQLERASQFHDNLAFNYANESRIVLPTLNISINNKYSAASVLNLLKSEITAKYTHRPFYSYAVNIERDIAAVAGKKSDLSTSKIRLFERKMQLAKAENVMDATEKETYEKEYAKVMHKISATHDQLQELHFILLEIRNYVVKTLEYNNEAQQARIEQLERENAKLQAQAMAQTAAAVASMYHHSKPVQTTNVTHVHIYHDDEDEQDHHVEYYQD